MTRQTSRKNLGLNDSLDLKVATGLDGVLLALSRRSQEQSRQCPGARRNRTADSFPASRLCSPGRRRSSRCQVCHVYKMAHDEKAAAVPDNSASTRLLIGKCRRVICSFFGSREDLINFLNDAVQAIREAALHPEGFTFRAVNKAYRKIHQKENGADPPLRLMIVLQAFLVMVILYLIYGEAKSNPDVAQALAKAIGHGSPSGGSSSRSALSRLRWVLYVASIVFKLWAGLKYFSTLREGGIPLFASSLDANAAIIASLLIQRWHP